MARSGLRGGVPAATGSPTTLRRVMEVILKEDVDTLGHRGDVVKVADGYGRNFLLPKKLAIEATAANRNVIEQMKQSALRRSAKEKESAQQLVAQMERVELVFTRKVGENEHLFGSVTSSDIAHALEQKGYTIDRRKVQLDEPLKQLGEFHIPVKLHREVSAHIKVTVSAESEGA
jgi:large subunit ribosomal protein L9